MNFIVTEDGGIEEVPPSPRPLMYRYMYGYRVSVSRSLFTSAVMIWFEVLCEDDEFDHHGCFVAFLG